MNMLPLLFLTFFPFQFFAMNNKDKEKVMSPALIYMPADNDLQSKPEEMKVTPVGVFEAIIQNLDPAIQEQAWGHLEQQYDLTKGQTTIAQAERLAEHYIQKNRLYLASLTKENSQ